MKFLITNMDGFRNKGCEASFKAIVDEIKKLDNNAIFKVFTWDPAYDALWMSKSKNVSFLTVPFKYSIFHRTGLFSKPWQYRLIGKLGISKYIRNGMEAFQWADAVLVTGGDVFSSTYSGLSLRFSPIKVATNFKKPVLLLGHSIGPFEKEKERKGFTKIMRQVKLITARESLSLKYLEHMKLKNTRIELTAEPAFCLKPNMKSIEKILKIYNIPDEKILIGISPSQAITEYSGISYDDHFKSLCGLIRFLAEKLGCHIILIPHVPEKFVEYDDRVICELLYRKLGFPENVTVMSLSHSAEEIRALVSKLDLMITERMHAAIASLSQNVPTFVVGYSIKAEGILGDILGFNSLEDYMISVKELNEEKLKERVKNLLDRRSECVKYLSKVMPHIEEKARRNFTLIMEVLAAKKT